MNPQITESHTSAELISIIAAACSGGTPSSVAGSGSGADMLLGVVCSGGFAQHRIWGDGWEVTCSE